MAYVDVYNAAVDTAIFQPKCLVATWKAAQDIVAEASNTPNHAARYDWAVRVLTDKAAITPKQLAMQVLRNPTIAASPGAASDNDISFAIASFLPDIIKIG